ncbi:phage tail protein [Mesorhizobium sp. CN2-181]|uniref:phage tail protein n=1 Tax=Mesorhizobium yinganensis TaxID=3157707 RepID=UPI0032B85D61
MVTARPHDPLRNFQFRLKLLPTSAGAADAGPASDYIAGVKSVSGLSVAISATEVWSGGNNRHRYAQPDKCSWEAITLQQGLARDTTLSTWAEAAVSYATIGAPPPGVPVKRNVVLDVWDPYKTEPPEGGTDAGPGEVLPAQPLFRFVIHNAWISRFEAMPGLDAMANEIALMSVELTHEGWHGLSLDGGGSSSNSILTEPGATDLYQEPGPDSPMFA